MKKTVWLGIAFVVAVVGLVVFSTIGTARYHCEVCITYNSRQACRTASASTQNEARRTATMNACAQIASGITESSQCENTPPDSVRWLER